MSEEHIDVPRGGEEWCAVERMLESSTDMRLRAFLVALRNMPPGARLQVSRFFKPGTSQWVVPPGVAGMVAVGRGGDASGPGEVHLYVIRLPAD